MQDTLEATQKIIDHDLGYLEVILSDWKLWSFENYFVLCPIMN